MGRSIQEIRKDVSSEVLRLVGPKWVRQTCQAVLDGKISWTVAKENLYEALTNLSEKCLA